MKRAVNYFGDSFAQTYDDAYDLARDSITKINKKYAGGRHPDTGVPYDLEGFPDYSGFLHSTKDSLGDILPTDVNIGKLTGSRGMDERLANKAAGLKGTPHDFTWHHHQDNGRMQLVKTQAHDSRHTGGYGIAQKALNTLDTVMNSRAMGVIDLIDPTATIDRSMQQQMGVGLWDYLFTHPDVLEYRRLCALGRCT